MLLFLSSKFLVSKSILYDIIIAVCSFIWCIFFARYFFILLLVNFYIFIFKCVFIRKKFLSTFHSVHIYVLFWAYNPNLFNIIPDIFGFKSIIFLLLSSFLVVSIFLYLSFYNFLNMWFLKTSFSIYFSVKTTYI